MTGVPALIRLSRPVNLLIMATTMYALRYLVILPLLKNTGLGLPLQLSGWLFFLSCLVLLSLAAAGNMINDYFDRKVDKINKPEKLIVGRLVKRRMAIAAHQLLNLFAVALTFVIAYATGRWSGLLFPIAIATMLWWYSPVLKKKPFVGNLAVALMIAAIPFWTGYFEIPLLRAAYADMLQQPEHLFQRMWSWISVYALFAFLLTLAREAIKDLEDLRGDTEGKYQTLPIIWGRDRTVRYIIRILLFTLLLIAMGATWMFLPNEDVNHLPFAMALVCVALPLGIGLLVIRKASSRHDFTRASFWIKITMAGGLLFLFVARWWILETN